MKLIRTHVRLLGNDIVDNYKEWKSDHYTFTRSNGTEVWTANGVMCLSLRNMSGSFNIIEKFFIRKCIAKSIILNAINPSNK